MNFEVKSGLLSLVGALKSQLVSFLILDPACKKEWQLSFTTNSIHNGSFKVALWHLTGEAQTLIGCLYFPGLPYFWAQSSHVQKLHPRHTGCTQDSRTLIILLLQWWISRIRMVYTQFQEHICLIWIYYPLSCSAPHSGCGTSPHNGRIAPTP